MILISQNSANLYFMKYQNINLKKAFTLAEIMIVLTIIGILTAILLPVAFHSAPDENVMKFKKGNNTLGNVIRELVNSDQYYENGDLGIKADGTLIDGTHDGDITYLCQTFADVVSTKEVNCSEDSTYTSESYSRMDLGLKSSDSGFGLTEERKKTLDSRCKTAGTTVGAEITTSDGIVYFQTTPKIPFGINWSEEVKMNEPDRTVCNANDQTCLNARLFGPSNKAHHVDEYGNDRIYKLFCMDVDGIDKGEDPFGYGIRADGKIIMGARAEEWMQKSVQKND